MLKDEALKAIPEVLDRLEELDRERAAWTKDWKNRRAAVEAELGRLRRIARGEETLVFGDGEQEQAERDTE